MIRYLIKNNFKLMFRNTWSIVVMLLGPVLVIVILSSAFSELMKSYEGVEEFTVGYRMENGSTMWEYMESIQSLGGELGIHFYECEKGEPEELMEENELTGFVDFTENKYVIYKSADYEAEGMMLEYFLGRVMSEGINASLCVMSGNADAVLSMNTDAALHAMDESRLPIRELEFMPAIDAKDYYGIIYIVYFCWCGMICATGVLSSEKKYGIERKYQVSNLSGTQIYLGRFIPITITVTMSMAISAFLTIWLYGIHWGNPLLSSVLIVLMIAAGSALGMMIYNIFKNLAVTIILLFTTVWFMGFFGGSFETYMFSSMPDIAKQLSPIYHGNRALVELSCMGRSAYVYSAAIYFLAIIAVCSVTAVWVDKMRRRGRGRA